ncbi:hypothetical protein [Shouchella lonarensis]|uniref:Spore coat-associated protein N n=1 Tax=Shouchella lonarensis TaxID=1464122 RepID=A0A1G6P5I6_9BACI|nr:hypothetical protein [Shouchella lonarensis]SDC75258.1 spore coat-associated protein N [Shouchella lonarensis]
MKKLKIAMIGTAFAGAIVLMVGNNGSFSWFTSETSASGQLTNGTLELNDGNNISGNIVQATNFAPSQLIFGDWLEVGNTGTLDAHLRTTYSHSIDVAAPIDAYKVGYIAIKYTVAPDKDVYEGAQYDLQKLFDGVTNERQSASVSMTQEKKLNGVEILTGIVDEDAYTDNATSFIFGDGALDGDKNKFWQLKQGQYIDINIGVKLDAEAGNEYQGATYEAVLDVLGKQTDEGALYTEK